MTSIPPHILAQLEQATSEEELRLLLEEYPTVEAVLERMLQQKVQRLSPDYVQRLAQHFLAFVDSADWNQSKAYLQQHLELLHEEASFAIRILITRARERKDTAAEEAFQFHEQLLQRCRTQGIETAFSELESSCHLNTPPLVDVLLAFAMADSDENARAIFAQHYDLLQSEQARIMMSTLIQSDAPDIQEHIEDRRALLHELCLQQS
jgi:hypothetical protein